MSDSKKGKTPIEPGSRRSRIGRVLSLGWNRQEKTLKRPPATVEQNRTCSNRPDSDSKIQVVDSSETPIPDNSEQVALDTSTSLGVAEPGTSDAEKTPEALSGSLEKPLSALPLEAKLYNEAIERLEKILGARKDIDQFPKESLKLPRNVADIDGVAISMSSAIAEFTEQREKLKQNKSQLRGMVETWYKASFPFVKASIDIVTV